MQSQKVWLQIHVTWSQVYALRGINNNFIEQASKSSFKHLFVKNDSLTPNTGESRGIEMVIKSDLDQIFIMSEKNGSSERESCHGIRVHLQRDVSMATNQTPFPLTPVSCFRSMNLALNN